MRFLLKMLEYFKSLFNLAQIGQSRTSITNPLQWTFVILIIAIVLMGVTGMPAWIVTSLVIGLLVMLALFVYAYLYCMHTNPDVLRSENFHLSKMAIERGLVGDSLHGLMEVGAEKQDRLRLIEGEKPNGDDQR